MSYKIPIAGEVEAAVREVAREQIDKAARALENGAVAFHERVHEVRKRLKKVRGALRLVRPSLGSQYSESNAYFRDLERQFAGLRDADAMVESVDTLLTHSSEPVETGALEEVKSSLIRRRARLSEDTPSDITMEFVREELDQATCMTADWELDSDGFQAIAGGVRKSYSRGRSALQRAYRENGSEAFHEWRKRVKYHRYHMRLLREMWPRLMKARHNEAKRLADLLGDDHDLTVLRAYLTNETGDGLPQSSRVFAVAAAERRSGELRSLAKPLGRKLFAEKPKHHVRRLRGLWKAGKS